MVAIALSISTYPIAAGAQDARWKVTVAKIPFHLNIYAESSVLEFELSQKANALSWPELKHLLDIAIIEIAGPTCHFEDNNVTRNGNSISGKVVCLD